MVPQLRPVRMHISCRTGPINFIIASHIEKLPVCKRKTDCFYYKLLELYFGWALIRYVKKLTAGWLAGLILTGKYKNI